MLAAACSAGTDLGPDAQRQGSVASFGDDSRLTARIEPGLIEEVYEADAIAWVVAARSAAPFASIAIENGDTASQRVLVEARNVDVDATAVPRQGPITEGTRREPACDASAFSAQPEVWLAPLPNEVVLGEDGGRALLFELEVPACSAIRIDLVLSAQRSSWRSAVVVADARDLAETRAAIDDALAFDPDHLIWAGRSRRPTDAAPYDLLRLELAATGVPYSVVFGHDDLRATRQHLSTFGPSDWLAFVGTTALLSLNTGTRLVGVERFDWLADQAPATYGGLVLTSAPPFDPDRSGDDGLAAGPDAARLQALLSSAGYTALLSAAGDPPSRGERGGIEVYDVGRATRASRSERVRVVELRRPWSDAATCDASCDGTCGPDGRCRAPCANDADCGVPGATCVAGTCDASATLEVAGPW